MLDAIDHETDGRGGKAAAVADIVQFEHQVSAAANDDVLHLDLMKMEWRFLPLADHEELFGIRLFAGDRLAPVADAEDNQAALFKPTRSEVRYIPSIWCVAQ